MTQVTVRQLGRGIGARVTVFVSVTGPRVRQFHHISIRPDRTPSPAHRSGSRVPAGRSGGPTVLTRTGRGRRAHQRGSTGLGVKPQPSPDGHGRAPSSPNPTADLAGVRKGSHACTSAGHPDDRSQRCGAAVPRRWRHLGAAVPATALALGLALMPMAASAQPAPAQRRTPATTVLSDRATASVAVRRLRRDRPGGARAQPRPAARTPSTAPRSCCGWPRRCAAGPTTTAPSGPSLVRLLRLHPLRVRARRRHRSLPHSSAAQYARRTKIAKSAIRPGDLVFFTSGGTSTTSASTQVSGLIWHAPHTGDHVRLARISTSSWVAGRVL